MPNLAISRVVLYKHGVGYFEREGTVEGDAALALTFKQAEVSDVLKSLTVLDLDGGHIASVSYDSTKPLEQLLAEVALEIPDQGSLVSLLPQIKGARVAVHTGVADPVEGCILGIDTTERQTGDGIVHIVLLSLVTDSGAVRSFDLHGLASLQILDSALRRDLDFYLRTQLSAKKKDARAFTFFAQGKGKRTIRLSYTLEAPVWKATYRILLGEENQRPRIQGWAVVDNTQDEDWEDVDLSLIAGLPVSFVHDLYTPRYIRRPVVQVQETAGVLPPEVEGGVEMESLLSEQVLELSDQAASFGLERKALRKLGAAKGGKNLAYSMQASSMPAQVRERKVGDLFVYDIEHPVTIRRNQSALVPIVLRDFEGKPVLLYNKQARAENPLRAVEFKNTTGLTLEGGPVTVLEANSYVGEAMLDTLKPDEDRLVPYAVELSVHVLDNIESHHDRIHSIVVKKGQVRTRYTEVQQTTYTFNNKADREQVLYLDHPRPGGEWNLFDTAEPKETTANHWRFRMTLPARQGVKFVVRQRRPLSQGFGLTEVSDDQLRLWLDQRFLDDRTAAVLRQAVELRHKAAECDRNISRLEGESNKIFEDQKRIRENLQALGERTSEKELRERFVKALNGHEDRLEEIRREIPEHQNARTHFWEAINALLARVEEKDPV